MLLKFDEDSKEIIGTNIKTFNYDTYETFQIIFMQGKHLLFQYHQLKRFANVYQIDEQKIKLKIQIAVMEEFYFNAGYFVTGAGKVGTGNEMSIFACGVWSDPDVCYVAYSSKFKRTAFRKPAKTFAFGDLTMKNAIKSFTTRDGYFVTPLNMFL